MKNIKLTLAYDGTHYHGFQRQQNALTIQEIVENKLSILYKTDIKINGSGRTDTQVHAHGQVINFYAQSSLPVEKIPLAMQHYLPKDIVVTTAEEVSQDFHARYSANSKIYTYKIHQNNRPDPFLRNYAWYYPYKLDTYLMNEALQMIVGTHDFSSFKATGSTLTSPVKTILLAHSKTEQQLITFTFWGTGFLYHMVRNLVGTIVDIGRRRKTLNEFQTILSSRNRKLAGITAPPQGLYLEKVFY